MALPRLQAHCAPVAHKRGRPRARGITLREARHFLAGRKTVRDFRHPTDKFLGAAHKRMVRGVHVLERSLHAPSLPRPRSKGNRFIAVADALWLWVSGERVTVYVILLRHFRATEATAAVVLPLRDWESEQGWREAFSYLPTALRTRLISITADEHAGLIGVVRSLKEFPEDRDCQPLVRYCQFHRLADLQRKLGKKRIRLNHYAAHVWRVARHLFKTPDEMQRQYIIEMLRRYPTLYPDASDQVVRATRGFVHDLRAPASHRIIGTSTFRQPREAPSNLQASSCHLRQDPTNVPTEGAGDLQVVPEASPDHHLQRENQPIYREHNQKEALIIPQVTSRFRGRILKISRD